MQEAFFEQGVLFRSSGARSAAGVGGETDWESESMEEGVKEQGRRGRS
jgi:hypothetical protein